MWFTRKIAFLFCALLLAASLQAQDVSHTAYRIIYGTPRPSTCNLGDVWVDNTSYPATFYMNLAATGCTWTAISGAGFGTVTSVAIAGTANQISIAGTCSSTSAVSCTLSLPNPINVGSSGNAATATDLSSYTSYSVFGAGNAAKAWITPGGNNYVLMAPSTGYATTTPGFVSPANARIGLFPVASEVGDLVYCATFAGSACTSWALLSGNTGTTGWLQETSGGAPSWTSPPGLGNLTATTPTANGVMLGQGTQALGVSAAGAADTIFMGNDAGTGAAPAFKSGPSGGTTGCAGATDTPTYNTSSHAWGCHQISGFTPSGTQYGLVDYATSSTFGTIGPPTTKGDFVPIWHDPTDAATAPTTRQLGGFITRTVTGASDTILYSDCGGGVNYTYAGAVAVALPTSTTLENSTCGFNIGASSASTVTFTPASSWPVYYNGNSAETSGTLVVHPDETYFVAVDAAGSAWDSYGHSAPGGGGTVTASGTPAQYDMSYWTSATNLTKVTAPATKGKYRSGYDLTSDAKAAPVVEQVGGFVTRLVTGASDTILYSDCGGGVNYNYSGAVAVALPTSATLENSICGVIVAAALGTTVTVTPASSWPIYANGDTGESSSTAVVSPMQVCFIGVDPAGSAWDKYCHDAPGYVSGATIATYLASPAAVGGTAPAAGTFTTVKSTATTNQIVTGATSYQTTSSFPAPAGNITLTFPITAEYMLGGPADTVTTHVAHSTAVAGVESFGQVQSGDIAPSISLTTPVLGAATATSLLASGIVDGRAPVTITTTDSCNLGVASGCNSVAYNSGYTFNQDSTAGNQVTYTLPVAVVGMQYCVKNSDVTGTARTGILKVDPQTSSYIHLNGVRLAASQGLASPALAGSAACFVATTTTDWEAYVQFGTWATAAP